ncbi:Gfo/Idh/MocA family protein [Paenibacillus contaminans]|uniref:Gfo/Idh/MocA family oxidoreductase n=1 Tax=Paenibacillus contaminans TaxID=450362 RepID=A0A329MLK6_9BACL|nr:Gfo/Idh/MocA family oxidoreductase [Paenibacillus contaminans]RAV20685.1 gfo/Idh/MocA family oxidoreductase [Paenibacillus contaminans]
MKIAIVGCGTMGELYARNLSQIGGVNVTAVCSTRLEAAEQTADLCRAAPYTSYEKMMEETDPDVLCVTLPTYLHKGYVMDAARRGKHAICEKPIAPNLTDAAEMIRACQNAGVRLFVGHVLRFYPEYELVRQKAASGAIGLVEAAHLKRGGLHPGLARSWYNDPAKSGGVILDLLIHDIDYARFVLGEVETVFAYNKRWDAADHALITLQFASGAIAHVQGFWGYPGPFTAEIELIGSNGIAKYSNLEGKPGTDSAPDTGLKAAPKVVVEEGPSVISPFRVQFEHFLACIGHGGEPLVTARDAYKAVEIALAAKESALTGMPVRLTLAAAE